MERTKNNVLNMKNKTEIERVYCICRSSVYSTFMIMCDICEEWYHGECAGVTLEESQKIDIYCCNECKRKNPDHKTTYKVNATKKRKTKRKHHGISSEQLLTSGPMNSHQNLQESSEISTKPSSSSYVEKSPCTSSFDFVDTTIRKAKTDAYQKLKDPSLIQIPKVKRMKPKTETAQLKQCYGPSCTKSCRKGSKYCSDNCGETLARHRILEILPQRLKQWMISPSVADERNKQKLHDIRKQIFKIEKQFEAIDIQIIQLIDEIQKSKLPGNDFTELEYNDTTPIDCVLCGMEIQSKLIERHLDQCYKKYESKLFVTGPIERANMRWNVFCNQRISENVYCKKMKVLCPQHYKDFRKADEVCGYKLGEYNGVTKYCGNIGKTCCHVNWEDKMRGQLDLDKLNLFLKYNKLLREKTKIRNEMRNRCNLLGLMLNETITH